MKQLIVTIGLIIMGLGIFRLMITDHDSLYNTSLNALRETKEAYLCTI